MSAATQPRWGKFTSGLVALLGAVVAALALQGEGPLPAPSDDGRAHGSGLSAPLAFVPNRGQGPEGARFYAQTPGVAVGFEPRRATLALERGGRGHVLGLRFVGANRDPVIEAGRRAPGRISYIGTDASHARSLPTYREVIYRDLWPGIDMAFTGSAGALKYAFRVSPGADPSAIRLSYEGATSTSLSKGGDLLVQTPLGKLRDPRPTSYQRAAGERRPIAAEFVPAAAGTFGIAVEGHDPSRQLLIDPGLVYGKAIDGADAGAIAVDDDGHAYVAGDAYSTDFPTTPGAYDPNARQSVAFVSKLNRAGTELVYSTVIGGTTKWVPSGTSTSPSGGTGAAGIDVDASGAAYVTGTTSQSDFPTTPGAFDRSHNGDDSSVAADGWVAKLSPDGARLEYSTFLGSSRFEHAKDVAVDATGSAYVTGLTNGADFPTTPGAADTSLNSGDAFVTKLTRDGSALAYSTFLGGSGFENVEGEGDIAVHDGKAYVTGATPSPDFPTTEGAHDRTLGAVDIFVTRLSVTGSAFERSTLAGGGDFDYPVGLAVDSQGASYVAGITASPDFPTTVGAFDRTYNGNGDAFALKLDATLGLAYSTFLGGSSQDNQKIWGDADVDARGRLFLTGATGSADFPVTPDALPYSNGGFLTRLSPDGTALEYSTRLGAFPGELAAYPGSGVETDGRGYAYVAKGNATVMKIDTSPDEDGDGVRDDDDNCPATPNADQRDADDDGLGDECDSEPGNTTCEVSAKGRLASKKLARLDVVASFVEGDSQPDGKVRYHDIEARFKLGASTVTSLIGYDDEHVTVRGTARVRGVTVSYRIDLAKHSGSQPQRARITLSNGYAADDELRGRILIDCEAAG